MIFRKSMLRVIASVAILFFAGLALPQSAHAAVSIVQAKQTSATATATTITLAFTTNVTAGSYIYVAATQVNNGTNTMSCGDSQSNSYTTLDNLAMGTGAVIAHCASTSASAGGADTVTVTFSATSTFRSIMIVEIAGSGGLDTSGTYHSATHGTTGTAMTSGTLTPSVANGLAIGAFLDGNIGTLTMVPGSGFTDISTGFTSSTFWQYTTGANHGDAAYQIYTSTASIPVTFTTSVSESNGGTVGALFKQAGGAGAVLAGAASDTTSATGALTTNAAPFAPILLDDPAHVGGSDNIGMGSGPNTGTGDNADTAFTKLKQMLADLNTMHAQLYPTRSLQTPTTGFSIVAASGVTQLVITPAGTLSTGTVTLPRTPGDNQPFSLLSSQTVTTLTVNTSDGSTINAAPTTIAANTSVKFRFVASLNAWFRE